MNKTFSKENQRLLEILYSTISIWSISIVIHIKMMLANDIAIKIVLYKYEKS